MIPGWESSTDDGGLDSAFCHHGFKVSTGFDSHGRDPDSVRVTIATNKGCSSGGCGNSDDGCGFGWGWNPDGVRVGVAGSLEGAL